MKNVQINIMRKFSIIMPTMNRPQFINRAVMAILDQTYDNWELIIQNGGNPIENVWDDERIFIHNEPDTGITDAMNKGMRKSTGDIFVWHNDDDAIVPDALAFVEKNLTKEWGYGYILMHQPPQSFMWGHQGEFKDLLDGNFVPQPSVYWTRSAYESVGDMDEEQDYTSDYDYWIRLWKHSEPQFFDKVMADYYLHPDQITQKDQQEQMRQARETAKKHR